jgi:catechol 2,3-dioxygenase-like lactoylglutathione lyase family enzyme
MPVLSKMVGFVTCTDTAKARTFYGDVLGFKPMGDDDFALVFDANGVMLRVGKAREFTPFHGTVLGWEVPDIHAAIAELAPRGVHFEQFNLAFMQQDSDGVWVAPDGDMVAWFKDPTGNVLSISQHVR